VSWLAVWTRAVIGPAWRRALPVWIGGVLVGVIVFGGTGMRPGDVTQLALQVPLVGAVLGVTWLLLFVPTARVIVRADAARYLRSLPAPRWPAVAVAGAALVGLQLPWLALWLIGERAGGVALVVALTLVIAVVALVRVPPPRVGNVRWRGERSALLGVYARAVWRRAPDALVRGGGLAILAGIAAGLFVRNNDLDARASGVLATAVIAVVLVPGWVGALLPIVDAHRASAWLAASLGVTERARIGVLAAAIAAVYVLATCIAIAACAIMMETLSPWLVGLALVTAISLALIVTRAVVWAERAQTSAARIVLGAVVASALAVVALGYFGALGAGALAVIAVLAVGTA
jgi:hypothetical protein